MSTQPNIYLSPEEYLTLERQADFRSEYIDGVVYTKGGTSLRHSLVTLNAAAELLIQLRGRSLSVCLNDMKVRLPDSRKFFYPDVVVVGGEPHFHDERTDVLLNPILIVEVLSESTEAFDRGGKFQAYQRLESLQEYILISQHKPVVEQYVRQSEATWKYTAAIGMESSLFAIYRMHAHVERCL